MNGGGGIYRAFGGLTLENSIVAGNTDNGDAPDLRFRDVGKTDIIHSLIGDTTGSGVDDSTGTGNLLNVDPLLGPLADNGGPTLTHALLAGSPALDAGDPSIEFAPVEFDQRGDGYARVSGQFVDIGAYEAQGVPTRVPGDYNSDGVIDAADYTVWRDLLGSDAIPLQGADGDGDGLVSEVDYRVWSSHFGFAFAASPATPSVPRAGGLVRLDGDAGYGVWIDGRSGQLA